MPNIETTFSMEVRISGEGEQQEGIRAEWKAQLPSIPGTGCRFAFPGASDPENVISLAAMDVVYNVTDSSLLVELDPDGALHDLDSVFSFAHANGCKNPKRWKILPDGGKD